MASVQISWTNNVNGEDHLEIKRKPTLASPEVVIANNLLANATTFTDTSPLVGNNYYSVQAVNGSTRIETAFVNLFVPVMTGTIDNVILALVP